ncbi:hypothetical protein FQR65_LT10724 [Abscondita terminalis]|nr:hypothetical protein FQR65_LT10724 [Abscondita terminalis]
MEPLNAPSLAVADKNSDTLYKKGNSLKYTRGTKSGDSSARSLFVLCVLCVVCVVVSVYSGWREAAVENQLNILENRVALLEKRSLENANVLIERVRKDVEEQFHKRVLRQAAAVAATSSVLLGTHKRSTRDVPECICPADSTESFLKILILYDAFTSMQKSENFNRKRRLRTPPFLYTL